MELDNRKRAEYMKSDFVIGWTKRAAGGRSKGRGQDDVDAGGEEPFV